MALDPIAFVKGFRYGGAFTGETTLDWFDTAGRPHPIECRCGERNISAIACNGPTDSDPVAVLFNCGHIDNDAPMRAWRVIENITADRQRWV